MPLHEYECDSCGHRFEVIRKFSDPPLEVCPKCGGHVRKLIASPAFQFKGSGWYITDYAKKDSAPSEKPAESKAGGDAPSESGGATDKKEAGEKSATGEKKATREKSTPAADSTSTAASKSDAKG